MKKLIFILTILACFGAKSQQVIDLSNPNYWINATISGTLTGNIASFNTINVVDSIGLGSEYVSSFTYTDSITSDLGNAVTGVGDVYFGKSINVNVTEVTAATYDLQTDDYILHVTYTATGAVTSLTLPTAQATSGRTIVIKDAGGNSNTNNITIDTEGAETIDGAATFVINTDYGAINLYSDGTNWYVY